MFNSNLMIRTGYDGSLINGLQSMSQWQDYFHHPSPSIMGLLTASMAMGSMLAIPIVPYCADLLGRRMGVVIGCSIMLVGIALLSMGFHIAMFIIGRLLLGFGIAIAHGSAPLLIAELVHPQHRAVYSTIYNTLWYLGSLIGAWVSFGTNNIAGNWAWRVPCLLQAIPSLFQIFFIWFVPESPRWLIAKGKHAQAKAILTKYHASGDENDELVSVEYHEIQQTISLEQEYEKTAWSELWSTPGNRHRLLILVSFGLFSQWSGNALVSYYLSGVLETVGITDDKTKLEINGYLSIVQLVSAVGICFFVDKIGRRPLFLTSCIGMLVSFIVETIGSAQYAKTESTAAGHAVIVFIFIYFIFYNLGFCGLLVSYSTEILPYRIRAKVSLFSATQVLHLQRVDADQNLSIRVSPSCSSSSTLPSGSTNTSTPSPSRPSPGSTTSSTSAGSPSRLLSSGSGSSRPRTHLSRRSPSTSTETPPSLVAMLLRSRRATWLGMRTRSARPRASIPLFLTQLVFKRWWSPLT